MIRVVGLIQMKSYFPSQWDGETDDGRIVCIRYCWGKLRMDVSGETVFSRQIGGEWDGELTFDQMKACLARDVAFGREVGAERTPDETEREACARIADARAEDDEHRTRAPFSREDSAYFHGGMNAARKIAEDIRARSVREKGDGE